MQKPTDSIEEKDTGFDIKKMVQVYTKGNYRVLGKSKHSAIKPCHWTTEKLLTGRSNRNCYKGYFGIESEICIQNTPALPFCNHQCVFCWRDIENGTLGESWKGPVDSPKDLADEMIRHSLNLIFEHITLDRSLKNLEIMNQVLQFYLNAKKNSPENREISFSESEIAIKIDKTKTRAHRAILLLKNCGVLENPQKNDYSLTSTSFDNLNQPEDINSIISDKVTTKEEIIQVFENAKKPKHAAISLAGEPTLYPRIGELVAEFRNREMSTFIVTNGTHPEAIKKLWQENNLPTQLYVTLAAPTKRDFSKICRPLTKHAWENLLETISILPQLPCRTVVRITSVKYLNINDDMVQTYADILKSNPPNFVDIKGFTVEANALKLGERLGKFKGDHELREFAPTYQDLLHFAQKLAEATGFEIIETHEASKDILIRANWPKDKSIKIDFENV
ncbi:MAG: radical SAM protein [Promethearchaeota archaeon]